MENFTFKFVLVDPPTPEEEVEAEVEEYPKVMPETDVQPA